MRNNFYAHYVPQGNVVVCYNALTDAYLMLPDTVCAQYMDLSRNMYACYADNYNEAVINYNGDVFKCTARDIIHNLNRQLLTHRINTLNENK